jgi:uncharacterized radical SAM superfamily Fe-S cluster-containing enzyme
VECQIWESSDCQANLRARTAKIPHVRSRFAASAVTWHLREIKPPKVTPIVRVMLPLGFLIFFNERLPNYRQEFISLNRLLQESAATGIEYTFLVCSPVTP